MRTYFLLLFETSQSQELVVVYLLTGISDYISINFISEIYCGITICFISNEYRR